MRKTIIYAIHSIYWTFYIGIVSFIIILILKFQNSFSADFYFKLIFNSPLTIIVLLSAVIGFYINYSLLFVRYYLNQKILKLILYCLLYSIAASLICTLIIYVAFGPKALFNDGIKSLLGISIAIEAIILFHGTIGLIIRGFITGYSDIIVKEELNRRNFETELALIRSQINPHFLFNTISNIDVLIQKNQTLASEYLNKLSEILRFSLYETDAQSIPLYKELEYIEKYIELQKIRTSNPDYVKYSKNGDCSNKMIAPMLFIPFIENAFKHSEKTKAIGCIYIKFTVTNDEIFFECSNTFQSNSKDNDHSGGKGNELTNKRIALLYPGKHVLKLLKEPDYYTVKLKITLT
ncbi:MAG: histidine kinase [Limnohabitans sp.]|nr:histidine kinase [Limnohabitans sp.]